MTNRKTSPCYSPKSLVVPKTLEKNQDTSVTVSHARKPSCYHQCGLISHQTHFLLRVPFLVWFYIIVPHVGIHEGLRTKVQACIIVRICNLTWETLPRALPTWLRWITHLKEVRNAGETELLMECSQDS